MSKVTIIIDSYDDDDVVEILECAPVIKPSTPVANVSIEAVLPQNKKREPSTPNKLPNITNTKPVPKPSSKTTTSFDSKVLSSKKQAPPSPKSKALPKPASAQPTNAAASSPRPSAFPSKVKSLPPPKPKESASPQRSTTPKIHHINSPNPIPAPVVTYSTDTRPSENPIPLDSVNKLFQQDARTVMLSKATRRASSSLSRNSSSVDISKKIEMDKELAAIFSSSSEPSSSTLTPLLSMTPTSSQTMTSPSVIDKRPVIPSSPPRQVNASSSQKRRQCSLFSPSSLNSPPAPTRKRPISSPQNPSPFGRPAFSKKKVAYSIDDEDGKEEDLELYINHVSSRRKLFSGELQEAERRKMGNKQCPICYMMFPKQEIMEHSFECDGTAPGNGLKKRTIGIAIALNAAERKKKNAGVQDTGPTNYYADSEGALALDGSDFGSEVTGLNWESAGQTRFA